MLLQFTKFTRSSAGLDKTLRLFQSICHVAIELSSDKASAAKWSIARSQFSLSRRCFRFFSFIDCFHRVFTILTGGGTESPKSPLLTTLELGRWSCLGLYLVLEDLTILHAMNVWPVPWNKAVLTESFKFWFYALLFSILGSVIGLVSAVTSTSATTGTAAQKPVEKSSENSNENSNEKVEKKQASSTSDAKAKTDASIVPFVRRIVIDGCDILIPGLFLGWIGVGNLTVGVMMVVSTLVSGQDIWSRMG